MSEIRCLEGSFGCSEAVKMSNVDLICAYPITPQIATGMLSMMAYGLCETVSQLIALEMAQKLLYPISVYSR